ncbi:protein kinase domain-containing protein [Nocardia sp. R6R-6]|uniref:protein kinase domain-containing protein n=1 Tax=Nocardia sp. R6R-6 TaxID=3459303 RepID=UPI00403DF21D
MPEFDPFTTQRDVTASVAAELATAGFGDAEEIGRGGFGAVYRCTQTTLDRVVAVKILTADLDDDNRARFLREQRAAGRLTGHPNIVNVLEAGVTDNGRPFIVMPYYPHGSLDVRIRNHGPLPLQDALRLGVKIAGALESAHRLGVLHRDIKPANILFNDYGEPALADFGIAHIAGGFVTGTGMLTGTPAFTAPEIVAGEPPRAATDVYGLGATLFAAVTGHAAFERRSGEQLVAQFLRITAEPVPDPREHGIPEDVSAIIESAMATDPADRPTAAALGRQLRAAQLHHGYPLDEMALHTASEAGPAGTSQALAQPSSAQRPSRASSPSGRPPADSGRTGRPPLELTSFVGRRAELTETRNLLSTSRLVTLTGIGGVGKTRLAMRVATGVQSDFPDGVTFVELANLRDESLFTEVVARSLGIRDHSPRLLRDALVEFLAPKKLLLVLDNCEQMVATVADLAESLLRSCPELRILATSREPIGISGEAVLPIYPLAIPDPDRLPRGVPRNDAMKLFAERGAAAVAGFEITEDNKVTIARICQRLDGLPLPIELAAARLRAMSPEQILDRLTDRFALLTRGSRSAPSRQQTLRVCIDWSYELCTPPEQRAWAQLSVFAGSFDLEAAQYVCGDDFPADDLLDTVTCLVEKSILTREASKTAVRFRMLDTVRDYGLEKLPTTDEYLELRRRHRSWYERLALDAKADWISAREPPWLIRFDQELPNLREALEFCVSDSPDSGVIIATNLFAFWHSHGSLAEGRHWFDRFLACRTEHATSDWAAMLGLGVYMAGMQGDVEAMAAPLAEWRQRIDHTTCTLSRAHLDLADGLLALFRGNPSEARPYLEKAPPAYTEQAEIIYYFLAMGVLGFTYVLLDNAEKAAECYEHGLAITETRGESGFRSYFLWVLAILAWRRGDRARANQLLQQSLTTSRLISDRMNASMSLRSLAWIAAEEQNAERAVVLTAAAERIGQSVGIPSVMFPDLQTYQDEYEHRTRQALSERSFAAAQREGAALGFDDAVAYALGKKVNSEPTSATSGKLTEREHEVAELIAEGLTNKEIAARLVISPRTAQGHVEHILTKLEFTSRTQIAAWIAESHGNLPGTPAHVPNSASVSPDRSHRPR